MNKTKYKITMLVEKIILYLSIAFITVIISSLGAIFFGTYKFLKLIARAQTQILTLQNQLVESAKEVVSLQNDLSNLQQASLCKKCNCTMSPEPSVPEIG